MNKSIGFGIPAVVLLFVSLPATSFGQQQMQTQYIAPTIVISYANSRPVTFNFTSVELQQIERDYRLVMKKLGGVTSRDCTTPYRISSCIWACRNGRKIKTCNPTLVRALERVWPK